MHTRPVDPVDDAFLFELFAATRGVEIAAWGLPSAQVQPLLRMQYIAQQRSYEQYPGSDHRLVLLGEERIGRIWISRAPHEIVLVDIILFPQYRGAGIGTRLVQALQAEASQSDRPLRLHVASENHGARRLYERLGFIKTEETATHYAMEYRQVASDG